MGLSVPMAGVRSRMAIEVAVSLWRSLMSARTDIF
jgi:hypothetical protein